MPIRRLKNPYQGINAHLHSIAQNPGGSPTIWTSIHADHITHITDALNALLPGNYIARTEQSLQIWTEDIQTGDETQRRPRPDSTIYASGMSPASGSAATATAGAPAREVSIEDMLEYDKITIRAVVVYQPESHRVMGDPVTRIELLSVSNKRPGMEREGYLMTRLTALRRGTSLIELDYLHQTPSPLPGIPSYPDEEDSHPYYKV